MGWVGFNPLPTSLQVFGWEKKPMLLECGLPGLSWEIGSLAARAAGQETK